MLKIAICDDKIEDINIESQYIRQYFENKNVEIIIDTYVNEKDFLDCVIQSNKEYQIVFMDVDLSEMKGTQVADKFHSYFPKTRIIYVSAYDNIYEVHNYNMFHYVRKHSLKVDMKIALNRYYEQLLLEENKEIMISKLGETECIDLNSVICIQMECKKAKVRMKNNEEKVFVIPLKEIAEKIEEAGASDFIQINRGCIVNMRFIEGIDSEKISLKNGMVLYASRRQKKEAALRIQDYKGGCL